MTETLLENLKVLHQANPVLVQRLCWPVSDRHIVERPGGADLLYRGACRDLAHPEATSLLTPAERQPVCLFGIGLGEALLDALERFSDRCVVGWDRDPWLLRRFLSRHDVRGPLREGRLIFQLGCDLEAWVTAGTAPLWQPHPLLQAVYRREWSWLQQPRGPLALVCEGGLFVDDLSENLEGAGYSLFTLDTEVLSVEEMAYVCQRLKPKLMAAINYRSGFAEFAAAQNLPLLSWEIDPTTEALPRVTGDSNRCHFFTYRRAQVDPLRENGFTHVEYLPLASEITRRRPLPLDDEARAAYGCSVSFVGSSMAREAEETKARLVSSLSGGQHGVAMPADEVASRLEAIWGAQAAAYERYAIPALVEERLPELLTLSSSPSFRGDPLQLVAEVAAARKRAAYVQSLLDEEIHVWGDEGWQRWLGAGCPAYRGRAAHGDELTRIYCASDINIDVNRIYQMDIAPMRIFDVLASGGFLLAEAGPALAELFDIGVELVVYRTLDELREQLRYYRARPEARARIAAAGHARVRRDHSIRARVQHMLARACPG